MQVACGVAGPGNTGDLQHTTAAQLVQHQAGIKGGGHLGCVGLHTPHKVQSSPEWHMLSLQQAYSRSGNTGDEPTSRPYMLMLHCCTMSQVFLCNCCVQGASQNTNRIPIIVAVGCTEFMVRSQSDR